MSPLKLATLNLWRRKIPTFLAVGAIAVAVACSGILWRINILASSRFESLGKGPEAVIGAKSGGIDILLGSLNGEGSYPGFLPKKLFDSLRSAQTVQFEDGAQSQTKYIRAIVPFLYFAKFKEARVVATDESFFGQPLDNERMQFESGSWTGNPNEAVIGADIATHSGLNVGDSFTANAWFGEDIFSPTQVSLKVAGILKSTSSTWDRLIYTDLASAQEILKRTDLRTKSIWGADVLNYFLVRLEPNGLQPLQALVNSRTVGQVIDVQTEKTRLEELVGSGKNLGLLLAILVLIQGGLCMASMLITRFEAMSMQLAVLRAIGYQKNQLGTWLVFEGLIIGLCAAVIGGILDYAFFPFICHLLGSSLPSLELGGVMIFASWPVWFMTLLSTTLAVIVPLYRVYHQDVHFSLRG
ncbi:hypothetical protein AZI86_08270 [Bdellovibrio bacteriovorus]|uniref:ABC3 transporter permease protein domain-containing protein n=1 Tax=Bdellovibrio bacteriovorus TaxID=959 RepID=A0A150WS26_BDEBC|nr:FtsX-like permease family protein [Bdellovibrio bacteriovorus]KYG67005.1 hypothetical protein AZI86_08270 [Bdellovibrio bacteriovorus]